MQVKVHIISSAVLALVIYYFWRSPSASATAFLGGILLDLDHLLDFWITRPVHPFSIKEFMHPCEYMRQNRKVYVFLHNYELVIFLWFLAWHFSWPPIICGIASGITLHLILDDIGNELITFSYFFIYRAFKKFAVFTETH